MVRVLIHDGRRTTMLHKVILVLMGLLMLGMGILAALIGCGSISGYTFTAAGIGLFTFFLFLFFTLFFRQHRI